MLTERGRNALFITALALGTRTVIAVAACAAAPAHSAGTNIPMALGVLQRLTFFDGGWYAAITAHGYSYAPDGRQHDVAFFPLYPSVVWCFMRLGLSFTVASLFVSSAAFLAALFITFAWVRQRCDVATARWTIAMLCCCPLSLFCSAAYSDGLFLLLTALALRDFDAGRFRAAAFWGGLASIDRFQGIALAPAFAVAAAVDRRGHAAWLAGIAPSCGAIGFGLFCALHFGDPLAFVHAQAAWRTRSGFDEAGWQNLLGAGVASIPALHGVTATAAMALWFGRGRMQPLLRIGVALVGVAAERWAWNGSEYVVLLTVGSAAAAFVYRRQLGSAATTFVLVGIGLIACVGLPVSVPRYAYDFIPASFALALFCRRLPALGLAVLAVMLVDLYGFARDFARGIFVA